MRRGLALVVLVVLLGVVWWKCGASAQPDPEVGVGGSTAAPASSRRLTDPKTLARGSLSGTVRDDRGAPIAGARVCAAGHASELPDELFGEPYCAVTDTRGAYTIANLLPARYSASAAARRFRPSVYIVHGRRELQLAAGEHRSGIDLVLVPGGVEVVGTVSDLTGGPIAKAHVWATRFGNVGTPGFTFAETDANGAFSIWVESGDIELRATADGYADDSDNIFATPGRVQRIELVLEPEGSVAGKVVDATTGEPVAGARVLVGSSDWGWDDGERTLSDDKGEFRVAHLMPRRYVVIARTEHGFGRTEGSLRVGLAQHVDGLVVKVHPARRITGRVVIAGDNRDCERAGVSLRDDARTRFVELERATDGTLFADGVLPATYTVDGVYCDGYLKRDSYPDVVATDRDALGVVWHVDPGATLRGRVTTKSGQPVDAAFVRASTTHPNHPVGGGYGAARTLPDGRYEIHGLPAGSYKIAVSSERGRGELAKVEVAARGSVDHDVVIEEGGTIEGIVVDADGKPVFGIDVTADGVGGERNELARSDANGEFSIAPLEAGTYELRVSRGDVAVRTVGAVERVTVRPTQTSRAKLVVESHTAAITGTVVDAKGSPIGDAFVSAMREHDDGHSAWQSDRPVVTATDGTFTLTGLAVGSYQLHVRRRGGGETIVDHVKTGTSARVQLKATGRIAGTIVRVGGPPDEFAISLRAGDTKRRETFYRTSGAFSIGDLTAGTYSLSVEAAGASKQLEITIGDGAQETVTIHLEALVTITGRVVDVRSQDPVAGMRIQARPMRGGGMYAFVDDRLNVTDATGRFTIRNVPQGRLALSSWGTETGYAKLSAARTVEGSGTIDVGVLPVVKLRIRGSEETGVLGVELAFPAGTEFEDRTLEVRAIDPKGPAARTDLRVGDVVATIDGVDARGANLPLAYALLAAPPGTKIALGLARGGTVTIVLAAP